jgi:hypothetical protein
MRRQNRGKGIEDEELARKQEVVSVLVEWRKICEYGGIRIWMDGVIVARIFSFFVEIFFLAVFSGLAGCWPRPSLSQPK